MGGEVSGKDWLNSWVTNLKENFVEKQFGKQFEQINCKNQLDKLG